MDPFKQMHLYYETEEERQEQEFMTSLFDYQTKIILLDQKPNKVFLKISDHFHASFFHKETGFTFIKRNGKEKKGFFMPSSCEAHEHCKREFSLRDFEDGYFVVYPESRMAGFFLTTNQKGIHYCGFCPNFSGNRSFYPTLFEGNKEFLKAWFYCLDESIKNICLNYV